MGRKFIVILVVISAVVVAGYFWRGKSGPASSPIVVSTTQPVAKAPTTKIAAAVALSYMDVVRGANRAVPATQPLVMPVELADAAHVVLHDPVYLDPLGHLWITQMNAPAAELALRKPVDPSEHVVPESPVFVHWIVNENGDWSAYIIAKKTGGGLELISSLDRKKFPMDHAYRWESAFSWDGKIVVPAEGGVSIFDVEPQVVEHWHELPGMTAGCTMPVVILDSRGVLAWAPWENGKPGSRGVSRFVDGAWSDLPAGQWPDKPLQFVPLLDGSILQMAAGDGEKVTLTIEPLESAGIDSHHVDELVTALSDPDADKRQAAFDELSRYGPGLWPILEKVTDQPTEARVRIRQLLRNKIAPALNGMTVVGNELQVVNRQADGTVLFFAPRGVTIPNGQRDPITVTPAWIAIHSNGRIDRPLPAHLIADQLPTASHLYCVQNDWCVCDVNGVRRYFGSGLVQMLREDERGFTQVVGVDRRGRWLFRKPGRAGGETLIIDPTILDPTPKLPVWTMTIKNGSVGWTADDYPVIRRGGAWALKADTWEALPEAKKVFVDPPAAALVPTTRPTTEPVAPLGPPLLIGEDGSNYFDGRDAIVIVEKTGRTTRWALPATAAGGSEPTLLRTHDGTLFLFNQPGRVVCIKPSSSGDQPFEIKATFTANIPNTAKPARIWLDPLGRIDVVFDNNVLAVMFPEGRIPPEISQMMLDDNSAGQ